MKNLFILLSIWILSFPLETSAQRIKFVNVSPVEFAQNPMRYNGQTIQLKNVPVQLNQLNQVNIRNNDQHDDKNVIQLKDGGEKYNDQFFDCKLPRGYQNIYLNLGGKSINYCYAVRQRIWSKLPANGQFMADLVLEVGRDRVIQVKHIRLKRKRKYKD